MHQPPWLRVHLTFDIDRVRAWCAADEGGPRELTWTAIIQQNGHVLAVYRLDPAGGIWYYAGPGPADPWKSYRWSGRYAIGAALMRPTAVSRPKTWCIDTG